MGLLGKDEDRFFADPTPLIGTAVLVMGLLAATMGFLGLVYLLLIAETSAGQLQAGFIALVALYFLSSAGLFYARRNPRKRRLPALMLATLAAAILTAALVAWVVIYVFGSLGGR